MYKLRWSRQARKDSIIAEHEGFKDRIAEMSGIVERNPFEPTPGHRFEKLKGYDPPVYTRRINRRNRFVYTVEDNTEKARDDATGELYEGIVYIHRLWGHYPNG